MKYCMNCGYKIGEDVKFCPECGTDLREAADRTGMHQKGREFSYSTQGMMFNSGFTLRITEREGKLTALYRKSGVSEQDAKQFAVEDSFFDRITEIIDRYNGDSWDGFDRHADGVLDGDSFCFSYSDGKERNISASGYMSWPEGLGMAIREIRGLYDEIYDRLWPDLSKQLQEYICTELVGKYGNSAMDIRQREELERIPFVHGDKDGYYAWGENPQPAGILGYGIFGGYEGKDRKDPGLRAVVVLAEKEKTEGICGYYTNLKILYYGLERGEKPRLLEEFRIKREMVVGNSGEYRIFSFGTMDRTTIGVYTENRFDGGDNMAYFCFGAYRLKKDGMENFGELEVNVSREDGKMSEDVMEAFCKKAEDAGLTFLSVEWGNEWRKSGFIRVPLVSSIFGCSWYSMQNTEMPANPDGSLAGTPIPGWGIKVIRQ